MVFEIIIFLAIGGVIVIVGRKLPFVTNSGQDRKVLKSFYEDKTMTAKPDLTKKIVEKEPKNKVVIEVGTKENISADESGQLDELLESINFINESNGDDFWEEPTFFSEQDLEKINSNRADAPKFHTKVKGVGDYDEPVKAAKAEKVVAKKTEEEPEEKLEPTHPDNLVARRLLPKTPIGVGLSTDLTLRDLLSQANKSFIAKNYLKAEEFYIKAASQDPNNPRIYSRLGIIYLKQGKYGDAKESLSYSIRLDESSSTQFFNLAVACLHLGERDPAVGHMKKAISIEPDNSKYQEILKQIS